MFKNTTSIIDKKFSLPVQNLEYTVAENKKESDYGKNKIGLPII